MRDAEREFLLRFFVESDAIEGIRNDEGALRALLRTGVPVSATAFPGHLRALFMLYRRANARRGTPVDEALLFQVQGLIVGDQHLRGARELPLEQRGAWRQHNIDLVSVTDAGSTRKRIGSPWERVPDDMASWLRLARGYAASCRQRRVLRNIRDLAFLHWRYERIHPFADGNGRSGRALVLYLTRLAGMEPFVFTHADRHETYYPCFEHADASLMERYFADRSAATRAAP